MSEARGTSAERMEREQRVGGLGALPPKNFFGNLSVTIATTKMNCQLTIVNYQLTI